MDSDDWRAVGAAWEALSVERRTEFDARLRANLQYQNARVLGTRCEYLCSRGSCGLAHCEGCADAMSGHPECYHERLRECGVVFDSAHHYLCPRCLQRHVALARIEPAGPPPSAVVVAIELARRGAQPSRLVVCKELVRVGRRERIDGEWHLLVVTGSGVVGHGHCRVALLGRGRRVSALP
jgi:hypothetical protein